MMFCNNCGKELLPEQKFCGYCGANVVGTVVVPQTVDRMANHVRLLGILWIVLSIMILIGAFAVTSVAHFIFGPMGPADAPPFIRPLLSMIGIFLFIKAAVAFILGWGLLQHEPWARILGLILGFISLLNLPFGTALGIYTLWVLMSPNAEERYRRLAGAA